MIKKKFAIIFSQFFFIHLLSYGQINDIIVSYNSTGNLQLGASIDYRFPERGKDKAITNVASEQIDGAVANSVVFSGTLISDLSKLYSKFNLNYDVTASGTYLGFFSASAEMHAKLDLEEDYTSNKLYYLIEASSNYGREGYREVQLKSEASSLVNQSESFIRKFGTHFVKYQTKSASIYLLYEITTSNKYSKNSLYTKFAGKFDFSIADIGSISASQSTEFSLFKTEARSLATVKIKFLARSSSGLTTIANLVDTAQSLVGIVNNLKTVLRDPAYNIGAVSSYTLTSFNPYGLNLPIISKEQQVYLRKFNNVKVQLIETKNRFTDYLSKIGNFHFKDYYKTKVVELTNYIEQLDQMESNCYDNSNCDTNTLNKYNNIPIQWLEEIADVDKIRILPSYESLHNDKGNKIGEIINGLRIIVYGKINNYEYFADMNAAYLNRYYAIAPADNSILNSHRLDTSNLISTSLFKTVDFIYLADVAKPLQSYTRNSEGKIIGQNSNYKIANDFLSELKTRTYFLEITSKDNMKFYTDLGVLNFNTIVTTK